MAKPVFRILSLVVPCLLLVSAAARATDFYVSPNGNGDGSIGNPWSLDGALGQPWAFHPGDTIWLRGGTYTGNHTSYLNGTSDNPVIVRQYPGERATLDGGSSGQAALSVSGSYTWFWGFEVMSSDRGRTSSQSGSAPSDIGQPEGIEIIQNPSTGSGLRFINLVIHDSRQGISYWKEAVDSEVNGCLIYYNGWQGSDRGHGHGIYAQNHSGTKKIVDNIIFQQFSHGVHAYTEGSFIDNIQVVGNTIFNNGTLSNQGPARNVLIGGLVMTHNATVSDNYMYYPSNNDPPSSFDLGYTAGCANATVTNNYLAENVFLPHCAPSTMSGNTIYGALSGVTQGQYANNTYYSSRPSGTKIFVRPNQYESGRANVTIFNWDNSSTVSVDLSSVLAVGTGYEIRNAQDFFGAPVVTGTYDGSPVSIPMTGLAVAAPVGWATPSPTGPEFNAFVILPASSSVGGGGGGSPSPGLPSPWQQSDIGPVGRTGSSSGALGAYTVSGSGADIWNTSDDFQYAYQPLSGDGTIIARVDSMDGTDPWAKAGVMIRESLAANSTHAMTVVTAGNGIAFQRRPSTGAVSLHTPGSAVTAPYWVKLVRTGNTFSGYGAPDGVNWTLVGSDTVVMAANVYVGLAVTSHNDSAVCNASMDNVALSNGSRMVLRLGGEKGTLTSPMAVFSDATAFGGQAIATSVANAGSASWTFNAPSDDTYYFWGRVKAVGDLHDSFFVKMDSGSEDVFDAAGGSAWNSSWRWTVLNGRGSSGVPLSVNPRTFSLSAGSHTLTFRGRETQTGLDRIIITNDPAFVPTEVP